jgi:microcystin-dependent protein
MFAGNFPPNGWMFCGGQLLPISENETLFQLIGTTYGGDGQSTFALPNLQSRVPMHQGNGFILAETGGVESVTLTTQQIPIHSHPLLFSSTNPALSPENAYPGVVTSTQNGSNLYNTVAPSTNLNPATITPTGNSQPHENLQPYLAINFIISLFGIFPSPT